MLNKTWAYGIDPTKQTHYHPVEDCTYWHVSVSLNNCDIIHFTNKTTLSDDFDGVHKVVIDGISENIAFLLQLVE